MSPAERPGLVRFAWLSVAAAVTTIGLKAAAYLVTGSVGLLSDALESLVNLAGAILTLAMLALAARPEDDKHPFGHSKAEYFASGAEGALVLVAATSIAVAAISRLLDPRPLEALGPGLAVAVVAALVNLVVGLILLRAARRHDSIALEGDARHLLTDVWTSGGVVLGLILVSATGWQILDPLIALAVAANIVRTGVRIVGKSIGGLMDEALPAADQQALAAALERYAGHGLQFHAVRTRSAGARRFVSFHVLVPGEWTVDRGHRWLERIEADVRRELPGATVLTHLESLSDPRSWEDQQLDRAGPAEPGPAASGEP